MVSENTSKVNIASDEQDCQVLFILGAGIGNVIEALYAVEGCLDKKVKTRVYLHNVNISFKLFLSNCYPGVIIDEISGLSCETLIHSFCVEIKMDVKYHHYFYVKPDLHSSRYLSESEQYMSIVKLIVGVDIEKNSLSMLKEDYSEAVKKLAVEKKTILYAGGSSANSAKRWPHFNELYNQLGSDRSLFVGGQDDLNVVSSYVYPPLITALFPQGVLNKKGFWKLLKSIGLMRSHAHLKPKQVEGYFEQFTWKELVALFRRAKNVVGNDGGLMHLAAASEATCVIIYGPTSVEKNRPVSRKVAAISNDHACQPCQFGVDGIWMVNGYISCPYQVKCLHGISVNQVMSAIGESH